MIIDFRLRPPYKSYKTAIMYQDIARSAKISTRIGMSQAMSVQRQDIAITIHEMEQAAISSAVVAGRKTNDKIGMVKNEDILELCNVFPEKFVALAGINPLKKEEAQKEIERYCLKGTMKGAVIEPGLLEEPLRVDDEKLYYLYEYCEKNKVLLMLTIGSTVGPDISYTAPFALDRVAKDFPNMQVIIAHGGWPWVTEFCQIAYKRPTVTLLPDMYLLNMPGSKEYIMAANYSLRYQMLFGSAYPFAPFNEAIACIKENGLRTEVYEDFFYRNAAKLLKLG